MLLAQIRAHKHYLEENQILLALPAAETEALAPHLQLLTLSQGAVLYEATDVANYVYFPTGAIVSLLQLTEDGVSVEIASVGNEGVVGVPAFLGGGRMPGRALTRNAGHAYRIRADLLRSAFAAGGPLQLGLLRYTQTLLAQMSQTAMCFRRHSVDQQLARWLLFASDQMHSSTVHVTQEAIANMIGVRREAVCEASRKLQIEGAIQYSRGKIAVLDRRRLEHRACECYSVVKDDVMRLHPHRPSASYLAG